MNIRKNIFMIICVLALAVGASGVCAYVMCVGDAEVREAENLSGVNVAEAKDEAVGGRYMLREYFGNIGVYICADGEYSLISVADVDIGVLPEKDIQALKDGIYLTSREDMLKLIEDYTS